MYPFIHIGPLTLGTYGLMVAVGLICAFFILRIDFRRRAVSADAEAIIGITGLAGLAGSRLYHLLESPKEFFADPLPQLFSTMGFAFVGAIIGGFIALVLLAKRFRISPLLMLDVASPAAAIGYGIGRIGCMLSGDGDYGIATNLPWGVAFNPIQPGTLKFGFIQIDHGAIVPSYGRDVGGLPLDEIVRVHPTPIYEFLVAILIFYILWRLGERVIKKRAPDGMIFAAYLVLTGFARFLVEIIRINPRSFFGMSNAQAASVVSVLAGIALFFYCSKAPATKVRS
ncbi:MAG TPA: prolipoprotein diacylglyceryl transferase family protein [Candidatus Acidoferrales bacterium]|nr:prolipoprotein diacylglyceryl transferase family protein [Candidatus Acidoferrales bacterium]